MGGRLVVDVSALRDRVMSRTLGDHSFDEILITEALIDYAESCGRDGIAILDEIEHLRRQASTRIAGRGKSWRNHTINKIVREICGIEDGTYVTTCREAERAARAYGLPTLLLEQHEEMPLTRFFSESTMSIHLKGGSRGIAKGGMPGAWDITHFSESAMEEAIVRGIADAVRRHAIRNGSIERQSDAYCIIQAEGLRVIITEPPLSDNTEITAVRQIADRTLEDYELPHELRERIQRKAEGILIAGSPGMGKSTLASALVKQYVNQHKIVKTIESPRDLIVPDEVTQYERERGNADSLRDVLLLTRPDYTVFDEMREHRDFSLYADLRFSGIGLVGVLHASRPIEAIERFLGKLEQGTLPQVIDTIIFVEGGEVSTAVQLSMEVKVPHGMLGSDLARPVVNVTDMGKGTLTHEIYSFGEETVVVPVREPEAHSDSIQDMAAKGIKDCVKEYCSHAIVKITGPDECEVYVPEDEINRLIGPKGTIIKSLEQKVGMTIQVRAMKSTGEGYVPFDVQDSGKNTILDVGENHADERLDILAREKYLLTAKASKEGHIRIKKESDIGSQIRSAIAEGNLSVRPMHRS